MTHPSQLRHKKNKHRLPCKNPTQVGTTSGLEINWQRVWRIGVAEDECRDGWEYINGSGPLLETYPNF